MKLFLKSIYQLLISILLSIFIIFPIFSIIFGLNEIRRLFVTIYFKLKGNLTVLSNGPDGIYGFSARSVIRIFCVFKGDCNFVTLKQRFIKGILQAKDSNGDFMHTKLRSTFVTEAGYNCWKHDKNFDLENHFRTLAENSVTTEENLMAFIQSLDKPLPKERPQWEAIFIPRLPSKDQSGLVFVMHHSYGDGLSFLNILGEQFSHQKPFPYVINPMTFKPPFWPKLFLIIKGYSYFAWNFVNVILNPPKISADRHPEEKEDCVSHNARFNLSLPQLKRIQKKTNGSTLSALFLIATQNALDKINKERLWLSNLILVAKPPYPKLKFCNRAQGIYVVIPEKKLDSEGNPDYLTQLQEVNDSTRVSSNLTFFVNDALNRLIGRLPASLKKNLKFKNVCLISNLPFTTKPFDLGGELITDCFVFPVLPQSIVVSGLSVGDKINVTLGAGANLLSKEELALFVDELRNQFNDMEGL